jgi:thiol-disulfide isomerase/thioredoxin
MNRSTLYVAILCATFSGGAVTAGDLRRDGSFGFPQPQARVLCDEPGLRLSCWNDASHLYVQAVLWNDGDDAIGESADGRPIGDQGALRLDADADGKVTPQIDRDYYLNPWPSLPGLRYQIKLSASSSTGLMGDSKGRGAIRYLDAGDGKKVRVDSFVIPLAEIGRMPGQEVRIAYYGDSTHPQLTVNSVGYQGRGRYYPHNLPLDRFHTVTLTDRPAALDLAGVPDGRGDPCPLPRREVKAVPAVGAIPPEITAKDWLGTDGIPRLGDLRGKVVLVEFWATWCGPCVENIPHLNALHDANDAKGLRVVSLTDQSRQGIEPFLKRTPIKGIVGAGSESAAEYGVTAIPHTFLIGRDGKLLWHGNPSEGGLEKRVEEALARE